MSVYKYDRNDLYRYGFCEVREIIKLGDTQATKDAEQDSSIASNAASIEALQKALEENTQNDAIRQSQLDANDETDTEQQKQIDANTTAIYNNTTEITNISNELPTVSVDGTTILIGKKGDDGN